MGDIKEIRDRIRSVSDTLKITNAMYMIASNKLSKAKRAHEQTEPFFMGVKAMMSRLIRHLPEDTDNKYIEPRVNEEAGEEFIPQKPAMLIITDDKGMAGAYNINILKKAVKVIDEYEKRSIACRSYIVGEVGRHYFNRRNINIDESFIYTAQNPTLSRARHITAVILHDFEEGRIDSLDIFYTLTNDNMSCEAVEERVLPLKMLSREKRELQRTLSNSMITEEFRIEPSPAILIEKLMESYITDYVYGCLVESFCSAQLSRMIAMDGASKSAKEMINNLQKLYNRQRQEAITQEISETANGALFRH